MDGFIALHRKIIEWGWYSDTNTFRVFIHLLLTANYSDGEYRGVCVKRGDSVFMVNRLCSVLKLTNSKIDTALKHLISTGEIVIKTTNKFSIATICNYDTYQFLICDESETKSESNRNQIGIKSETYNNKQNNNIINKKIDTKVSTKKENSISKTEYFKKTVEERKKMFYTKFIECCKKKYGDNPAKEIVDMCSSFYNHWTEVEYIGGSQKMLFEKRETFQISGRLATWERNRREWSK